MAGFFMGIRSFLASSFTAEYTNVIRDQANSMCFVCFLVKVASNFCGYILVAVGIQASLHALFIPWRR